MPILVLTSKTLTTGNSLFTHKINYTFKHVVILQSISLVIHKLHKLYCLYLLFVSFAFTDFFFFFGISIWLIVLCHAFQHSDIKKIHNTFIFSTSVLTLDQNENKIHLHEMGNSGNEVVHQQ